MKLGRKWQQTCNDQHAAFLFGQRELVFIGDFKCDQGVHSRGKVLVVAYKEAMICF